MAEFIELLKPPKVNHPVRLFSGNVEVASLRLMETDFPFAKYEFVPWEEWKRLGSSVEALSISIREGREGVARRIDAIELLDLRLFSHDLGVEVRDFLIHIRGSVASVRSFPRGVPLSQVLPQR